jgi:hypothetical protein
MLVLTPLFVWEQVHKLVDFQQQLEQERHSITRGLQQLVYPVPIVQIQL